MLLPGDVVWADFPGAKETKQRPCVVVSSELYQNTRPDVLLAVVTTNIAIATAPTDFVLFPARSGPKRTFRRSLQ